MSNPTEYETYNGQYLNYDGIEFTGNTGDATVTFTSNDGGFTATIKYHVVDSVRQSEEYGALAEQMTPAEKERSERMWSLLENYYPRDSKWGDCDTWVDAYGTTQDACYAFALMVRDYGYGKKMGTSWAWRHGTREQRTAQANNGTYKVPTDSVYGTFSYDKLEVGDILVAGTNDNGGSGHAYVIVAKYNTCLLVAEGNYNMSINYAYRPENGVLTKLTDCFDRTNDSYPDGAKGIDFRFDYVIKATTPANTIPVGLKEAVCMRGVTTDPDKDEIAHCYRTGAYLIDFSTSEKAIAAKANRGPYDDYEECPNFDGASMLVCHQPKACGMSDWEDCGNGLQKRTCSICGETEYRDPSNPFTDVSAGAYYYDAVKWAVANKVTSGTGATTFGPNDQCTRAQFVTFLWRAAGKPEPKSNKNPFADVPEDYYTKAVLWAAEEGIVYGTDDTHFSPAQPVQRSQAVTFLYRFAGKPAVTGTNKFTDVKSDDYFKDAVLWGEQNGVVYGTDNTHFSPTGICVRAQTVTFLYRYLGK